MFARSNKSADARTFAVIDRCGVGHYVGMRDIEIHEIPELGPTMKVQALDEPGPGGASHSYKVDWGTGSIVIDFQKGPRGETTNNGLLEPALLAIILDRAEAFMAGPFPSAETARSIVHLKAALAEMHNRQRERIARGVQGQSKA